MATLRRYDYKGWARYTLSSLLEQEEQSNDEQRRRRIKEEQGRRDAHQEASHAQYELKEQTSRLNREIAKADDLTRLVHPRCPWRSSSSFQSLRPFCIVSHLSRSPFQLGALLEW